MPEIFDSLGRIINRSVEEIQSDMQSSLKEFTKAASQSADSSEKMVDLVGRLEKIISESNKQTQERRNKSSRNSQFIKIDPSDMKIFETVAKSFQQISDKIDKKYSKDERGSKVIDADAISSPISKMFKDLSKQTFFVKDIELNKTVSQFLSKMKSSTLGANNKEMSKFVKAGLKKGSIYTHDYAAESLLTEISNDIKLAVIALREISEVYGVNNKKTGDVKRLFDADLKSITLATLSKKSLVTDKIIKEFDKRIQTKSRRGASPGSLPPGLTPAGKDFDASLVETATSGMEDNLVDASAATHELAKALKSSNLKMWTKEIGYATGTTADYIERGIVEILDQFQRENKLSPNEMEMAANTIANYKKLSTEDKRQIQYHSNQLDMAAKQYGDARRSGVNDPELKKKFENEFLDSLKNFVAIYRGTSTKFLARLEDITRNVSQWLVNLQRVVEIAQPSNYGIMPEFEFGNPIQAMKKYGEAISTYSKDASAAVYAGMGKPGKEIQQMYMSIGEEIDSAYKETGALADVFRGQYIKNLRRGVTSVSDLNRVTKTGLALGKLIGANAENTAEEFTDWHLQLGLSTDELDTVAKRTMQIGKLTGVTGDNLLSAVKSSKAFVEQMRNANTLTSKAAGNFIQISASAQKMGVEGSVGSILEGLSGTVPFLSKTDGGIQALMAQAATRSGTMGQLLSGTLMQDKNSGKAFHGGLEEMFRMFSGGIASKDLDKIPQEMLKIMNLQINAATEGKITGMGEFKRVLDALEEGLTTAADKFVKVEKELSGILTETDRRELELKREQLKIQMGQEKLDDLFSRGDQAYKKIKSGGDAKSVLIEQFGSAQNMKSFADELAKEMQVSMASLPPVTAAEMIAGSPEQKLRAKREAEYNKQRTKADKARDRLLGLSKGLASGAIDPKEFIEAVGEAKDAQGAMSNAIKEFAERDNFAKLQWEVESENLEIQKAREQDIKKLVHSSERTLFFLEENFARLNLLTNITNQLHIISSGLVGLAAIKHLVPGMGKYLPSLGRKGAAAKAGSNFSFGEMGAFGTGTDAFGTMDAFGATGKTSKFGKFAKVGGKLATKVAGPLALLDLLFGAFTGLQEGGEKGGVGMLPGAILGILTGDAKKGSFLSESLGIKKGSTGDELMGVAGSGTRGAAIGATIGTMIAPGIGTAIGAVLGGYIGGISELFKVLTDSSSALYKKMKPVFDWVSDKFTKLLDISKTVFQEIYKTGSYIFGVIGDGIESLIPIFTALEPVFKFMGTITVGPMLAAIEGLSWLFSSENKFGRSLILLKDIAAGFINEIFKVENIKSIIKTFFHNFRMGIATMLDSILLIPKAMYNAFSWAYNQIATSWIGKQVGLGQMGEFEVGANTNELKKQIQVETMSQFGTDFNDSTQKMQGQFSPKELERASDYKQHKDIMLSSDQALLKDYYNGVSKIYEDMYNNAQNKMTKEGFSDQAAKDMEYAVKEKSALNKIYNERISELTGVTKKEESMMTSPPLPPPTNVNPMIPPGSPASGAIGSLPFRSPQNQQEIGDVEAINNISQNLSSDFYKKIGNQPVNLKTLDAIASDVHDDLKSKPNYSDQDYQGAVQKAFIKHLGSGPVTPVKPVEASSATDIQGAVQSSSNRQQAAKESDSAKLEESNVKLSGIEGHTQTTAEEAVETRKLMEQLVALLSARSIPVAGNSTSIPNPTNYYNATISPNTFPNMGGVLPQNV